MDIKTIENTMLTRSVSFKREAIDEDARTVEIAFSSEKPYRRYFGDEVLSHDSRAVDMEFLSSGTAPLLADHNSTDQIGVIEKAWIDNDRKGRALVRFGKSARAEEFYQDVLDGIRANISVGYAVKKWEINEETEPPTYTAIKWQPMENSFVSVPADDSVGVGRNAEVITKKVETMPEEKKEVKVEVAEKVDVGAIQKEARAKETARIQEITVVGKRRGFVEDADEYISTGKSVDAFREHVWSQEEKREVAVEDVLKDKDIGLSEKEANNYSFLRAFRAQLPQSDFGDRFVKEAGFEIECSREAAKKSGVEPNGLLVPVDVLKRSLNVGTATAGGNLVATDLLSGSFIEVLRNVSAVLQMGATTLTDLNGNIAIPRQTAGSAAGWIAAEDGDAANSEATFDQIALSPKTLGIYGEVTRQLLLQSSIDVENFMRFDMAKGIALAIDKAAMYGTGALGQPKGISLQTGINAPTDFVSENPTFAEMVAMETAVADDNALMGNMGYLFNTAMRGGFKTSEKFSGTGQTIWEPGGSVNGYKTAVSNQVVAGNAFFGNWADLLIGMWGGLDILVDPYSNSLKGRVRIVAHQSMDIAIRHPESFAFNEAA